MWAVRNILKGTLKFTDITLNGSPLKLKSRTYFDLDSIDGGRPAALASEQLQRCFNDGYLQLIHRSSDPSDTGGIQLPSDADSKKDKIDVDSLKEQINSSGDAMRHMMQQIVAESQKVKHAESSEDLDAIKQNMALLMQKIEEKSTSAQDKEISELKELVRQRSEEVNPKLKEELAKLKAEQQKASEERAERQRQEIEQMKDLMKQQQVEMAQRHEQEMQKMQSMMKEVLYESKKQSDQQKQVDMEQADLAYRENIENVKAKMDNKITEQSKQIEMLTQSIMNLAETTQASNQGMIDLKQVIEDNATSAERGAERKRKLSKVDIDAALVMADSMANQVESTNTNKMGNQTKRKVEEDVSDLLSETDLDFD